MLAVICSKSYPIHLNHVFVMLYVYGVTEVKINNTQS